MIASVKIEDGGMAEWLKAAVLKTVNGVTRSGVRIPLPPPIQNSRARYARIEAGKFSRINSGKNHLGNGSLGFTEDGSSAPEPRP